MGISTAFVLLIIIAGAFVGTVRGMEKKRKIIWIPCAVIGIIALAVEMLLL